MGPSSSNRVWGIHAIRALLKEAPTRLVALRFCATRHDARVAELLALSQSAGVKTLRVPPAELERLAPGAVHQGVVADIRPLEPWDEAKLLAGCAAAENPLLLVLDGVQDPHNLGACLRTANACGALAVVVPRDRAAQLNATVRKVAAGAAEFTPVVAVTNLARALRLLKDAGLWIVGADPGASQCAAAADLTGGCALVLGAEGGGLRELTRKTCDLRVRLPAVGQVESLNVSVAAGMLLYEARRQREARNKN
ncbi:MAG: 23S rRNA (guanosine(2251)-2'-O)-methyltransferase RlmB [Steroidobacteraceae bacterium]|nr:23S rRNA (guanosine(2251)-2'-O)-methyltransferase RlmB [Steroidobacteraceae bacterium]MDW8258701.1 23S rRNA (guanosine(2251)-2'-O)-methyltransferase RlmB [Gammaproteobacteria bacterium]